MVTRYDVGETVLIPFKVQCISINAQKDINYIVEGASHRIEVLERQIQSSLFDPVEGDHDE